MTPFAPFAFCSSCGHRPLRNVLEREFVCDHCGYRHFVSPVAAAVAIVADDAGRVLLIRRARDPGRGKLGLPGGFIDAGETAEQAVRREVFEEVNLRLETVEYFDSIPNRYRFQDFDWPVLDVCFAARVPNFDAAKAEVEVEEVVVLDPSALVEAEIAFPSNVLALKRFFSRVGRSR